MRKSFEQELNGMENDNLGKVVSRLFENGIIDERDVKVIATPPCDARYEDC